MASSLTLRRAATSSIFTKALRPFSATRAFSNGAEVSNVTDTDRSVDAERRSDRSVSRRRDNYPGIFSDAFDPFSPPRSLNQMLNFMDQFMDSPFLSRGLGYPSRRGLDVKEDENTLVLRMDMPGLSKDDVKIAVEQNTLIIRGEASEKESDGDGDEETGRRYSNRIDLPPNLYKFDEIKAGMKNGVLKITVPKVKEDERKDVFHVNVE